MTHHSTIDRTQGRGMHHETSAHIFTRHGGGDRRYPQVERRGSRPSTIWSESGSYYVPASAIADRMIERILIDRQDSNS